MCSFSNSLNVFYHLKEIDSTETVNMVTPAGIFSFKYVFKKLSIRATMRQFHGKNREKKGTLADTAFFGCARESSLANPDGQGKVQFVTGDGLPLPSVYRGKCLVASIFCMYNPGAGPPDSDHARGMGFFLVFGGDEFQPGTQGHIIP